VRDNLSTDSRGKPSCDRHRNQPRQSHQILPFSPIICDTGRPSIIAMRLSTVRLQRLNCRSANVTSCARSFSSGRACLRDNQTPASSSPSASSAASQLSPRWLSDLKAQATASARTEGGQSVLKYLEEHWLELMAGAEGFLSGPRWTGLASHKIQWGDMVR
jgi:hypothetical protein